VKTDTKKVYVDPALLTPLKGHSAIQDRYNFWTDGAGCANAGSCVVVLFPPERIVWDRKRTLRAIKAKRQSALNNKLYLIIFDFKMEMILW